jgi:hypothetical protein
MVSFRIIVHAAVTSSSPALLNLIVVANHQADIVSSAIILAVLVSAISVSVILQGRVT